MPDSLNPILNPDCECPTPAVETPSPCEDPNPVDIPMQVLDTPCDPCPEDIVPPPLVIPDLTLTSKCYAIDPAYNIVPATDLTEGVGNVHYFVELHPACVRPLQNCEYCVSNVTCPEDIGLVYRKGFDNTFSMEIAGAVQPLLFWVHDSDLDHVMNTIGYIKVMQQNMRNEWVSRENFQTHYALSPSMVLPYGMSPFLNEMAMIGSLPTVVTEEPITSVLD